LILIFQSHHRFLWASCQIDQLSRLTTPAGVESALSSLPRGLYGTYNRILLDIPPENEFLVVRTLKWLAHAVSPLSLGQLVEVVAVEDHNTCLNALQKLYVPEDIFQICGSLIRCSESTGLLTLAHHSVYEFLTSNDPHSRAPRSYYVPSSQSMVDLAVTCLTYLSFKDFALADIQSFMGSDSGFSIFWAGPSECLANHAFFDYALRYWFHHLPTLEVDFERVWPFLKKFFDSHTGNFGSSILVLRHLEGEYKYPVSMKPVHFCATHDLSLVINRLLIEEEVDLECRVEDGRRAIHMAAENGQEEAVKLLLNQRVDINRKTIDGRTPLQLAMESGNETVARLLIKAGADINANLVHGETALSLAMVNKWYSLANFLLQNGADPNGRLGDGRTPLHVAATVGSDSDMLQLLLEAGARSILDDEDELTPLHLAAYHGHAEAALVLMETPNIDWYFKMVGWTPLHYAIQEEHLDVVRLFHRFGYLVSLTLTNASSSPHLVTLADISMPLTADTIYKAGKPNKYKYSRSQSGVDPSYPKYGKAGDVSLSSISSSNPAPGPEPLNRDDATHRRADSKPEQVPTPLWLATCQQFLSGINVLMDAGVTIADRVRCKKHAEAKGLKGVLETLVAYEKAKVDENVVIAGVAELS
jgi:ankyrin repeat protein